MAKRPRPIPSNKRITTLTRDATRRASTAKFFIATAMAGPIQVCVHWHGFERPPSVSGGGIGDALVIIPRGFEKVVREAAREEWEKLKKKRKRPPVPPRPRYHEEES